VCGECGGGAGRGRGLPWRGACEPPGLVLMVGASHALRTCACTHCLSAPAAQNRRAPTPTTPLAPPCAAVHALPPHPTALTQTPQAGGRPLQPARPAAARAVPAGAARLLDGAPPAGHPAGCAGVHFGRCGCGCGEVARQAGRDSSWAQCIGSFGVWSMGGPAALNIKLSKPIGCKGTHTLIHTQHTHTYTCRKSGQGRPGPVRPAHGGDEIHVWMAICGAHPRGGCL